MRKQTFFVVIFAAVVFAVRSLIDVNGIPGALSWLVGLMSGVVAVSVWHLCRKWYFDHGPGTNMRNLFAEAPPGDRLKAIAIFSLAIALLIASAGLHAQDVATRIPPQARQYLPMLGSAIDANWPDAPERAYLAALIEHESGCFSMPRKCWNPRSELKTHREHGVGFTQFTAAYRADGSVRFDKLAELASQYPQLAALNWGNVMQRPDLQLTASTLGVRDTWRKFRGAKDALRFADAAWNGGVNDVNRERRTCKLTPDCDPDVWPGNVELHCMKSHAALYGTRSACDINRFHVRDVFMRIGKYRGLV